MPRWILGILILVAACTPNKNDKTPNPILWEYTQDSSSGFAAAVRPIITTAPDQNLPALEISGTVCDPTPSQTFICQGWIANHLSADYSNITLKIELQDDSGEILASETGIAMRDWIPSNSGSPYRVIFAEIPAVSVTPIITLLSAEENTITNLVALPIENPVMTYENGIYHISGKVINEIGGRVDPIAVVVTLRDQNGDLMGFRVLQTEQYLFETTFAVDGEAQIEITADGYRR